MKPGMAESHVSRLHSINANPVFKWRKQYEDDSPTVATADEDVVSTFEFSATTQQVHEFRPLLSKKTMETEILSIMPKPDGETAVMNLVVAFSHYNGHRAGVSLTTGIYYRNRKRENASGYGQIQRWQITSELPHGSLE